VPDLTSDQVTAAYGQSTGSIRTKVLAFLLGLWAALPDHRDAAAARFIAQTVPVVAGAQLQIAQLTSAYLSLLLSAGSGRHVPAIAVRAGDVEQLRGVTPATIYQRPFTQIYTDLSRQVPYPEAVDRGRIRLIDLASTDLQLAKTHTAQRALADQPIAGYRRVLNGPENCGLCVIASTQRYHTADLMPIHPGCDCIPEPIIGGNDPGQVLDQALLDSAHAAIEARFGKSDAGGREPIDYRKVLLVQQHGEIGPVLTVKGQQFTGPDDLTGSRS